MILIQTSQSDRLSEYYYLIAGRVIQSGFTFIPLLICETDDTNPCISVTDRSETPPFSCNQVYYTAVIYNGLGWLGGQWHEILLTPIKSGYCLNIAEIGDFYIAADGSDIVIQSPLAQNNAWLVEAVLGPTLTLALALQDTFCLHASAVAMNGQIVAFIGESGWGKSTLTAYLNRECGNDWQFVADDVLPVISDGQTAVCLPHFPQLKLPTDQQWSLDRPRRLPLTAVYLLTPPNQADDSIQVKSLTTVDAALALVRHTIAAKLFDAQLLSQHLAFAATVANHVPVKQLIYPRLYTQLPSVSLALVTDLMI